MLSVSWLGARREWINGVVDGGDRGGVGLDHFAEKLGRLSQQERLGSDWLCDDTTTKSMNITLFGGQDSFTFANNTIGVIWGSSSRRSSTNQ
jgi:hypothetical protein